VLLRADLSWLPVYAGAVVAASPKMISQRDPAMGMPGEEEARRAAARPDRRAMR
jgi:hypothetical protein